MRSIKFLQASFVFAFLLFTSLSYGQGVAASGDIKGTVVDPTGAVVADATVTATDVAKGTKHTVTTDSNGFYRFMALPPATYDLSATKTGFHAELRNAVVLNIGQTDTIDFRLKVSSVTSEVEVTTQVPLVETDRGSQSNVLEEQSIRDLPINRRDYLTFTLLAPGVSDSTRISSDQDFRVKQTPQSGLSFYGNNGRGNNVTVDGGESNDDSGGVRLNLSQDAVQEFQINRSNYGADLGGASGATINIVSKSGTNNVHGSAFGFFRDDAFDARNPFSFIPALAPGQTFNPAQPNLKGQPVKDSLSRQQYGGTIGFPIQKDKTFVFASFEGLRQEEQRGVPLLTNTSIFRPQTQSFNDQQLIIDQLATLSGNPSVPCLTGQPALPAATCAGILANILTINPATSPLSTFIVNQFESNGGLINHPTREYLASGRLDHQFSDKNQVNFRYNFGKDNEDNPDNQALTGFSAGNRTRSLEHTAHGAWFHQFSSKTINDAHAQFSYTNFDVFSNSPAQVGLLIQGFASLGSNIFLPNFTIMRRYEFADNLSLMRGKHDFKLGVYELYRGNHTESHTFFPGRFVFGSLPGGILSPCLQVPAACGLTADPASINALQSFTLGLPQFYQQGFGNPVYNYPRPFTAGYFQDTWNMSSKFTLTYGLRYEVDSQYGALPTDKNNLAPRVSFAWDLGGDHKTVARAGYGVFYSPIYGQIADVVQTLGVVNGFQQIAQRFVSLRGGIPGNPTLTSATIFQTLFAQGKVQCVQAAAGQQACITPADLTQFGINVTHNAPLAPFSVTFGAQDGYRNPYSQQGSVSLDRQVGNSMSVSASYIYVHTIGLPVALDANLLPTAPITNGISPLTGQPVAFRNWAAPQCSGNPSSCFANPLILQNNIYSSAASALYQGGVLELKKRFSNSFSLMANYTYSRAYDTSTDFNSDYAPFDETNLKAERALSDFDQRHKITVATVFDTGKHGSGAGNLLSNWGIAPIIRYNSGHPYNILAGADVNGDRHSTNDRPLGVGRNAGIGPDYLDLDLRISRAIKITEGASLNFIAEGFNIFNRTNFSGVNNVDPTVSDRSLKGFEPSPLDTPLAFSPQGFASASARRQLQFGVRLAF
jgi:carboxypeptidase family protein